ncbi:hypothetical protein MML48_3g00004720 [Holotrichia oblita]|uniref:Uncharacterized protein n=1 Tax=Holotrichia oblita TaxID=644536 RepID=A0ACB9TGN8_HOLOL|nr:hypothetical protein MML48_3g00004720 [Holotrichia oblita]
MHADIISFTGKSDPIVCQYAEDYLRKHKTPHIKNLVSNKIREMRRLLIPLKQIFNINSTLEALVPENFDKVVAAARIVSGYDESTKSFTAPSLALHFRTILLAVCSAAKTLLLKKDPIIAITDYDKALSELKKFRELVATNWKYEMGSLAPKDINEKHSSIPQKLPLSQDIILFKNYCHNIATDAMKNLKQNFENIESFKKLSEAALALTISLNRKRLGDVQYMKLETYNTSQTNIDQTECLNVILSESDKELTRYFKRVVTVGKGSKPVAVLFPKPVQDYINVLLDVRKKTAFVPKENPLPQELYQTSKIAKLLLTIERGVSEEHKGKTLDEIDAQLETWVNNKSHSQNNGDVDLGETIDNTIAENINEPVIEETNEINSAETSYVKSRDNQFSIKKIQEKGKSRGTWSNEQKKEMLKFFKNHIKKKISPKKAECLELQRKYMALFGNKTWVQIKVFVYNTYKNVK